MGLIEFLIFVVVCVLVTYAAIWIMGQLAPGHPQIIDRALWVLCVVIVVLLLLRATGLLGADPQIPRIR